MIQSYQKYKKYYMHQSHYQYQNIFLIFLILLTHNIKKLTSEALNIVFSNHEGGVRPKILRGKVEFEVSKKS